MSNRPISRVIPPISLFSLFGLASCDLDSTAPRRDSPVATGSSRVAGVVEIRFERIGSPDMSTNALVAGSVAELEALRAERARTEARGETFTPGVTIAADLTVPMNTDGSGDATIHLDPVALTNFEDGSLRYFQATYQARNAQTTDQVAFDTPRDNLTFLPVSTARTIASTPIIVFETADGSPADTELGLELLPTGAAELDDTGAVVSAFPDVLQVFEEAEVAGLDLPEAVTDIYPYGFMVRRAGDETTRMLDPTPEDDQFDGIISFAYRIPLQTSPADDPSTITLMFLALDDSNTRVTQSLEEQNPVGRADFGQRGSTLGAAAVNLLPGGSAPGLFGVDTRFICSVRTAGPAGGPLAHLVDVGSMFVSFSPDPYAAEGSFVAANTILSAMFSEPVDGAGPDNFTVRGLQSGPKFRGQSYSGNGTATITTPAGTFLPGEEIELVVTRALSCPQPRVARLRVATSAGGSTFNPLPALDVGPFPSSIVVGDLNGDGAPDLLVTNAGDGSATTIVNNGGGTFTPLPSFPVGSNPSSAALGDMDDDGVLDLIVANRGDRTVVVPSGNGDGTFGDPEARVVDAEIPSVATGDFNGDGILDIAGALFSPQPAGVAVAMGNGDGTFGEEQPFPTDGSPDFVATADFDGNGALDLAALDQNQPRVFPLLGHGDGTFTVQPEVAVGSTPVSLAVGDFNGDGNPDLAAADMNSSFVSVLLGNGDGTFEDQRTFGVGNQSRSVVTGDFDADGDLDLAVSNQASSSITILYGTGDGDFELHETIGLTFNPGVMSIGDLDGDGILDLAVANENQGTVTLLLGGE